MKSKTSKLLVFDGNNLIHRMYHIAASFDGGNTEGMVMGNVLKMVKELEGTRVTFVWDQKYETGYKSYRKQLLGEYKDGRDTERNVDVYSKTDVIIEALNRLGVPNIFPGVLEADDIMAYLANTITDEEVCIISVDKDVLQLVNRPNVTVYSPIKKMLYDRYTFENEFGFPVEKYGLYKSIIGDKSDNIQGIPGFADKKAKKILNGEIALTEEYRNIIKYNMNLMDLNLIMGQSDLALKERALYDMQIDKCNQFQITDETFNDFVSYYKANIASNMNVAEWRKRFYKSIDNKIINDSISKYFS